MSELIVKGTFMPVFIIETKIVCDGSYEVRVSIGGMVVASGLFGSLAEPENHLMWLDCQGSYVQDDLNRYRVAEAYRAARQLSNPSGFG